MKANNKNGIAGRAQIKNLPWTDQGVDVSEAKTQQHVLEMSGLNYEIAKEEVMRRGKPVTNNYFVVRTDTDDVYGIVGGRWRPLQNHDMFMFFDEVIELLHAKYDYAGYLRNGEIPWIISKTNNCFSIRGVVFRFYIMVLVRHDGDHSSKVIFLPVQVDSNTILPASTGTIPNIIPVSHKCTYDDVIEQAAEISIEFQSYTVRMGDTFQKLFKTVTREQEEDFFYKVVSGNSKKNAKKLSVRMINKIHAMMDYYRSHKTLDPLRGSALGLYCAVMGYYQNVKDYSTRERTDPAELKEKKFNNLLIKGDAVTDGATAFHLCNMLTG